MTFNFSTDLELGSLLDFNDVDFRTTQGRCDPPPLTPRNGSLFQDLELIHNSHEHFALLDTNLDTLDDDIPHQYGQDYQVNSSPAHQNSECSDVSGCSNSEQLQTKRVRVYTKTQRESLCKTVKELTATIQALETTRFRKKAEARHPKNKNGTPVRQTVWMKIAGRQLEMRRKAELENSTLRRMVQLQVQEAKYLKCFLKRRRRIQELEILTGMKKLKHLADNDSEGDFVALQAILSITDALYVEVDAVFNQKKMDAVACPGRRKITGRHGNNDIFLELSEKQLLPFNAKATTQAVWTALRCMGVEGLQCIKDFDGQVHCHAQHRRETNDTMAISHLLTNSSFNTVFAFHCRKVVRKYVEQDRSVFSCVIKTQPTLDTSQFCTDTCTLQVVVRSIEENVSLIESFYNVKCRFLSQRNAVLSGDFDTFVLAVYNEMFQRFTESVDSYLLDSS